MLSIQTHVEKGAAGPPPTCRGCCVANVVCTEVRLPDRQRACWQYSIDSTLKKKYTPPSPQK